MIRLMNADDWEALVLGLTYSSLFPVGSTLDWWWNHASVAPHESVANREDDAPAQSIDDLIFEAV